MDDSPWGYKESDVTELLTHTHTRAHTFLNLHDIINQLYFNKKLFKKGKPTVGIILMIKDNTLRIMQGVCSCHLYSAL